MTTNPEMAVTQELLPCPFCGGDELSHGWNYAGIQWAQVECHNDACQANVFANTETEAIAAWNTRATPPVLEDVEAQAMKIACHAVLQSYGEGGRREAQAATLGRLWKDHPAYQAALMALATRPAPQITRGGGSNCYDRDGNLIRGERWIEVNGERWYQRPAPPAQPSREEVEAQAMSAIAKTQSFVLLNHLDLEQKRSVVRDFAKAALSAAEPLLTRQDVRPERLREAAEEVLTHRVGDLPGRGWLRDNDASRAALARLAAALSTEEPKL